MADSTHLELIRQGAMHWNHWRIKNPAIIPDLSKANLRDARLGGANLNGVNLSMANLFSANLQAADLKDANLFSANLGKANLITADLTSAGLNESNLSNANLTEANLFRSRLSRATLSASNMSKANLCEAVFRMADLSGADLSGAVCHDANFVNTNLAAVNLIGASLNGAKLTGACLWETQRAGWTIKNVVCKSVFWDKERKVITTFAPGEFERIYSNNPKVQIRYPSGIEPLEIITLPALIQHLESSHPGSKLRFESIQDAANAAVLTLVIENQADTSLEQVERLRSAIQAEAEEKSSQFRQVLREKEELILRLDGQVEALKWTFNELLLSQGRSVLLLQGDLKVGDEYNISGQAGAVGPNAQAHNLTFNQLVNHIDNSVDFAQLADELRTLREAMTNEAKETSHYIAVGEVAKAEEAAKSKDSSKVIQSLKSAGKWTGDVATKIGVSLAAELIKQSMGLS